MRDLAGRYRLDGVLGAGGSATVYRALDRTLGVERALKVLRADESSVDSQRARLRGEARAMARVNHPNILRVYDVGTDEEQDFVVMELALGGTLQDRIDREGPVAAIVACQYALQVLGALASAHDAGVIHRDVKPQNVLLDEQGVPLLADFGIALLSDGREARQTSVGVAMGSMTYMPPEQRLDARGVGPAADIYALGATFYALLTGASPVDLFLAASESIRWDDVPEPLCPIIQRATRLDPEERYGSAREMAGAILAAMSEIEDTSPPDGPDALAWASVRDRVVAGLTLPDVNSTAAQAPRRSAITRRLPLGRSVDPTVSMGAARGMSVRGWFGAIGAGIIAAAFVGMMLETVREPPPSPGLFTAPRSPSPSKLSPSVAASELEGSTPPGAGGGVATATGDVSSQEGAGGTTGAGTAAAAKTSRKGDPTASSRAAKQGTRTGGPTAVGKWSGSFAGKSARFDLRGSNGSLRGSVTQTFQGTEMVNEVLGSFDPDSKRLELVDVAVTEDSGRYSAVLTDDPALEGRFEVTSSGRVVSFRMIPAP